MPEGNDTGIKVSGNPLSPHERGIWNAFLRFVYQKGYTGNPELDVRDKSIGKGLFDQWNKEHPDSVLQENIVPRVQGEFQYFKQHGMFPGYKEGELGTFQGILGMRLKDQQVSPVDSWFGSLTSRQAYPVAIDETGKSYGTDYGAFVKAMEEKYRNYGEYLKKK